MKAPGLLVFVCLTSAWAQAPGQPAAAPMPNLPDETVLATFDDGVKMTMGDFKRIYSVLPAENQQQALNNRQSFLQQWALMRKLAKMAEADKLDQMSPSKEALEYYRLVILSQAKMNQAMVTTTVLPSQVSEYYEANKEKYMQVKVKAIYVGFGGKNVTEETAKAKATKLVQQARSGADFIKLVRDNSDDETSRAKDGDFAILRPFDNIPDAIRGAIFQLKEGQISAPVRQSNGYYIFLAQQVTYRPFTEVRDDIFNELKQRNYGEWIAQANRDAVVMYNNAAFIGVTPIEATPKK
jgi:peptidyl-prolyl cis-trans isomerase C